MKYTFFENMHIYIYIYIYICMCVCVCVCVCVLYSSNLPTAIRCLLIRFYVAIFYMSYCQVLYCYGMICSVIKFLCYCDIFCYQVLCCYFMIRYTHLSGFILAPDIGLVVRVFANGPGDLGSIPGRVIPKTQKWYLIPSLLNTQHYKVRIKGKVEQSREKE